MLERAGPVWRAGAAGAAAGILFPPAVVSLPGPVVLAVLAACLAVVVRECEESEDPGAVGALFGACLWGVASRGLVYQGAPVWLAGLVASSACWGLWAACGRGARGVMGAVLLALSVSGAEFLRARLLYGASWMELWAAFAADPWAYRTASVLSREAVTLVVALSGVSLASALKEDWWRAGTCAGLAVAVAAIPGFARLPDPTRQVGLAAILVDLQPGERIVPHAKARHLALLVRMSRAAAESGASLVVWPENAVLSDPVRDPLFARALADASGRVAVVANGLVGQPAFRAAAERSGWPAVASLVVDRGGKVAGGRWKSRRFAFGEFGAVPGSGARVFETSGAGRVGVALCLDALSEFAALELVRDGVQVLAVAASFAVAGRGLGGPYLDHARMLAAELGVPAAVSGLSGMSAVVSRTGRVVAESGGSAGAWLSAGVVDVPGSPSGAPFRRLWLRLCGLAALGALAVMSWLRGGKKVAGGSLWRPKLWVWLVPPVVLGVVAAAVELVLGARAWNPPVGWVFGSSVLAGLLGWLWAGSFRETVERRLGRWGWVSSGLVIPACAVVALPPEQSGWILLTWPCAAGLVLSGARPWAAGVFLAVTAAFGAFLSPDRTWPGWGVLLFP